ncbi:MAG: pilin [Woeseiaceae bacterium]
MRKLVLAALNLLCLSGCSQEPTQAFTIADAEKHGFVFRTQPMYQLVGAQDGAKGSWMGHTVEIYEFATHDDMNVASFENMRNWEHTCVNSNLIMISDDREPCDLLERIGKFAPLAAATDDAFRAQLSSAYSLTTGLRLAVIEFYQDLGRFPANNDEAGVMQPEEIVNDYVQSVSVQSDGSLLVKFRDDTTESLRGKALQILPQPADGTLVWWCKSADIPVRSLAEACQ